MRRKKQSSERVSVQTSKSSVKKGFKLSAEAAMRLGAAALVKEMTQSEIVDELILAHLKGYFATRRNPNETGEEAAAA